MTPSEINAATEALESLSERVDRLNAGVNDLRDYGKRNRKFIRWLGAVAVVLLLLVGSVIWVAANANDASNRANAASHRAEVAASIADQTKRTQKATCLATNETRAEASELWNSVLDVVGASSTSPQGKQFVDNIRGKVASTYAPRDCSK